MEQSAADLSLLLDVIEGTEPIGSRHGVSAGAAAVAHDAMQDFRVCCSIPILSADG